MGAVPRTPEEFFGSWLPSSFATLQKQLGSVSSPGAIVFAVGARPPLSVRLLGGELKVTEGLPDDTIVQVRLGEAAFEPVFVRGAEWVSGDLDNSEHKLALLRALTLDAERIGLIRGVPGSVAFILSDDQASHEVWLTPGVQTPNASAECTVRCLLSDFLAMQRGESNPFELMMNGKIQISGDAQIPMALSSLLV